MSLDFGRLVDWARSAHLDSVANVIGFAGLVAALSLLFAVYKYMEGRRVAVRLEAMSHRVTQDGVKVVIDNRSSNRDISVKMIEALHWRFLRSRQPVQAGSEFTIPKLPVRIGASTTQEIWLPLRAVDGSNMIGAAKRKFDHALKIRITLDLGKTYTSRAFKIESQDA